MNILRPVDFLIQGVGEKTLLAADFIGNVIYEVPFLHRHLKGRVTPVVIGSSILSVSYVASSYFILTGIPSSDILKNNRGVGVSSIEDVALNSIPSFEYLIPASFVIPTSAKIPTSTEMNYSVSVPSIVDVSGARAVSSNLYTSSFGSTSASFPVKLGSSKGDIPENKVESSVIQIVNVGPKKEVHAIAHGGMVEPSLTKPSSFVQAKKKIEVTPKVPEVSVVHNLNPASQPLEEKKLQQAVAQGKRSFITPDSFFNDPRIKIQARPSKFLQDVLAEEKNGKSPLSLKEFNHLSSLVNYEGTTPLKEAIYNIPPSSQRKFYGLFVDFNKQTGEKVNLKSAWRSKEKQAGLSANSPIGEAASSCGSAHAMAAVDIDRNGQSSRQASMMKDLGLLNRYGLWIPPEVGEAWHVEDPSKVYFRFGPKISKIRGDYVKNVCSGLSGANHDRLRVKQKIGTINSTYWEVKKQVIEHLSGSKMSISDRLLIQDYVMFALRAESIYGSNLVSKTGALGLFQFTQGTGAQYKIRYYMEHRDNVRAMINFTIDNLKALKAADITPSIESLYLSHMLGFQGFLFSYQAFNGIDLGNGKSTFDRISAVNMSKELFSKYFTGSIAKKNYVRNPKYSQQEVARVLWTFFRERAVEYKADNLWIESGALA
jgi:hypothetical protein